MNYISGMESGGKTGPRTIRTGRFSGQQKGTGERDGTSERLSAAAAAPKSSGYDISSSVRQRRQWPIILVLSGVAPASRRLRFLAGEGLSLDGDVRGVGATCTFLKRTEISATAVGG